MSESPIETTVTDALAQRATEPAVELHEPPTTPVEYVRENAPGAGHDDDAEPTR